MSAPIRYAAEILGSTALPKIWNYLKPGARLAVGVCSTGGFVESTGEPYLNDRGMRDLAARPSPGAGVPFGVKEILLFLGYGIETKGILEIVKPEDLFASPNSASAKHKLSLNYPPNQSSGHTLPARRLHLKKDSHSDR
jgi:hypothetical protein